MTGTDSQNLNVCCTAQKLPKIKDFLAFAFAKKQSKSKKAKEQKWLGMSYQSGLSVKHKKKILWFFSNGVTFPYFSHFVIIFIILANLP